MREAVAFYRRWFVKTVWRAPGVADGYAGLAGTILGIAQHYRPELGPMTQEWVWQLPLWAFAAVLVVRFFTAPFQIWKEDRERLAALQTAEKRKQIRGRLGELLVRGVDLQQALADKSNEKPPSAEMAQAWYEELIAFLGTELDSSYVARMKDTSTVPQVYTNVPQDRVELWGGIRCRVYNLQQFIRELA